MRNVRRLRTGFLTAALLISTFLIILGGCDRSEETLREAYIKTGEYLLEHGSTDIGSIGAEWVIIGLSRSGRLKEADRERYLEALYAHAEEAVENRLHPTKSTENSRLILGATAVGIDPRTLGKTDLVAGISDMEYVTAQGLNGPIWALIALDSGAYRLPTDTEDDAIVTREKLVSYIVSKEKTDGGFSMMGGQSDVDLTAMAVQALAPYRDRTEVREAIEKALSFLADRQEADGGYICYGKRTAETVAQVMIALTSLGLDPDGEERFIKSGRTLGDVLLSFRTNGGFCHEAGDGKTNAIATEQAYLAMTAYFRLKEGKKPLYEMGDL